MISENSRGILILASGNGSNAEKLWKHAKQRNYPLIGVLCDQPEARVLERAYKDGVATQLLSSQGLPNKIYQERLREKLQVLNPSWILLAGFMRLLSKEIISDFYDSEIRHSRILNIHPSLLPQFPGLDAYRRAYEAGVPHSGVSIHFVDEGMDTGEVLWQQSFPRIESDTLESFSLRGRELEHKMYPLVLDSILTKDGDIYEKIKV